MKKASATGSRAASGTPLAGGKGGATMRHRLLLAVKLTFPFILAVAVLWWMYRGLDLQTVASALSHEMSWTWMLLSLPFGILAQALRALRWKQLLTPVGERPRTKTCLDAVFVSYASSLVIPRVGEVLRCGILKRYEGTCMSRAIGTVVTERMVDTLTILVISFVTILTQIPVYLTFFQRTGISLEGFLSTFSPTGYAVTAVCLLLALLAALGIFVRIGIFSRTRAVVSNLCDGLLSIRKVRHPLLFALYSIAIWACYYLHFYLTFLCFGYTSGLGCTAALVAFVVGTFAVLVPTPNGAGPWHFAVKTVLVMYGVGKVDGTVFVLIVHTVQTLLVVALGIYACFSLAFTKPATSPGESARTIAP